jgi:hypothetical protein
MDKYITQGIETEVLKVYLDNQGAIALAKNLESLGRAKHMILNTILLKILW